MIHRTSSNINNIDALIILHPPFAAGSHISSIQDFHPTTQTTCQHACCAFRLSRKTLTPGLRYKVDAVEKEKKIPSCQLSTWRKGISVHLLHKCFMRNHTPQILSLNLCYWGWKESRYLETRYTYVYIYILSYLRIYYMVNSMFYINILPWKLT